MSFEYCIFPHQSSFDSILTSKESQSNFASRCLRHTKSLSEIQLLKNKLVTWFLLFLHIIYNAIFTGEILSSALIQWYAMLDRSHCTLARSLSKIFLRNHTDFAPWQFKQKIALICKLFSSIISFVFLSTNGVFKRVHFKKFFFVFVSFIV